MGAFENELKGLTRRTREVPSAEALDDLRGRVESLIRAAGTLPDSPAKAAALADVVREVVFASDWWGAATRGVPKPARQVAAALLRAGAALQRLLERP